ncbi:uncharacterized protein LOC102616806 isoform X3 [Citrus sinensis]|uniref:uncharacterized protein LOC102616806 isoform X3 n=1 Tax=Citrus sinensis TaxID=2711 RepID=UPI00227943EF|nr:uncharacterized protein LOC102616806 isoform X3 [Citrus sinensis]
MDSLIKQVRFSSVGQENPEEPISFKERRILLQKTQYFKGEKRTRNWLRRQFSRQMSGEFDPNTQMDHATAVAAAAYAINKSIEESRIPGQRKTSVVAPQPSMSRVKSQKEDALISNMSEQKKNSDGPDASLRRQKSKKDDTPIPITEPGRISKRFSEDIATTSLASPDREVPVTAAKDEGAPEKAIDPSPIKKTPTFRDELLKKSPDGTKPKRSPSKVTDPSPSSMKKAPTFADEVSNRTSSKKPEGDRQKIDLPPRSPGGTKSKPDIPPPIKPATPPTETKRQIPARPPTTETQADAWEKAEMARIKERYEKLNETILSWEERKKKKARRKLDRAEGELEKRRVKALQKFRSDMESIDRIAGGARAQAQEKRRKAEFKAKEKANKIRTTGKIPATTCSCF